MVIAEAASGTETPTPLSVRLGAVVVAGLVMGAVTSVLQKYLNSPWLSLVNAASPWLAPACAVGGGPVLGLAGWLRRQDRVPGRGASVLAAAFLAEAAVGYGWRLHYTSSAILFALIGVAVAVLLGLRDRRHPAICRWLLVTVPAGAVAELILGLVYDQSF